MIVRIGIMMAALVWGGSVSGNEGAASALDSGLGDNRALSVSFEDQESAQSRVSYGARSAGLASFPDFNSDGFQDVFEQPSHRPGVARIRTVHANIAPVSVTQWTGAHPQIAGIDDWSRAAYTVIYGNFTSAPGDEMLLVYRPKVSVDDYGMPILMPRPVRGAIIEWDAAGNAHRKPFIFDRAGLYRAKAWVADFDGDGLDEILFQNTKHALLVESNGYGKQTLNPGYLGQQWRLGGSTIRLGDFNGDGRMDVGVVDSKTHSRSIVYGAPDGRLLELGHDISGFEGLSNASLAGETAMEFQVDEGGNATVNIPLVTPPGTADVVPSMSLRYSSAAGNGVMGMGWSIGGLSVITRCPKNYAQDGVIQGILFNDEDAFCLDGQRLIEIERSSTAIHYRTEIANFNKVQYLRNAGYFVVDTKAGERHTYGGTANSLIENSSRSAVQTWALSRIQDIATNYIDFSYKERDHEGEFVIDRVRYTGNLNRKQAPYNEIHFIYESDGRNQTRADSNVYYMAGGNKVSQTELLRRVEVMSENQPVRVYFPHYETAPHTNRLRMTHLQECAYNGQCIKPLTFDWFDIAQEGFHESATLIKNELKLKMALDLNGNGISDAVFVDESEDAFLVALDGEHPNHSKTVFGKGSGASRRIIKVTDITGDGIPEIFTAGLDGEGDWVAYQLEGTAVNNLSTGLSAKNAENAIFMDVNGDGLLDYVYTAKGKPWVKYNFGRQTKDDRFCMDDSEVGLAYQEFIPSTLFIPGTKCLRADPGYFSNAEAIHIDLDVHMRSRNPDVDDYRTEVKNINFVFDRAVSLADFDGDGVSDLLSGYILTMQNSAHSQGNRLKFGVFNFERVDGKVTLRHQVELMNAGDRTTINALDINTDGLSDIVVNYGKNVPWQIVLNQGGTFEWLEFADDKPFGTDSHASAVLPVDINGDGKMEFIIPDRRVLNEQLGTTQTKIWSYRNGQMEVLGDFPAYPIDDRQGSPVAGDFNGDRFVDIVMPIESAANGSAYLTTRAHKASPFSMLPFPGEKRAVTAVLAIDRAAPDTLQSVTQSYGRTTRVDYRFLSHPDAYTKGSDAEFPVVDIGGAIPVVSGVTETDERGGNDTRLSYHYAGMRMHAQGRGNLGFRSISSSITRNNTTVRTETRYHQDFPLTGLPETTRVTMAPGGHTLQGAVNDWQAKPLHGGKVFFPQKHRVQDFNFFFNGRGSDLLTTTTTSQRYENDNHGNVSSVIVEVQENTGQRKRYRTETINLYGTTDYDKRYGRLRSSTVIKTLHGSTGKEESRTENTARFTYYGAGEAHGHRGLLKSETIASGKDKSLSTTWRYDAFGNRVSTRTTGRDYDPVNNRYTDAETRTQGVVYDGKGRFVLERYNALNQRERMAYDRRLSQVTRQTDVNGLVTESAYDPLGRVTRVINANGTWQDTAYLLHQRGQGYPGGTAYLVRTQAFANTGTALAPASFAFFNALGLEIEQRKPGFDGTIVVRKAYDRFARLTGESLPFYAGKVSQPQWTRYSHDAFDRVTRVTHPNGYVLESNYNNGYFVEHRHTNTGAAGNPVRIRREYVDGRGKIYEVRDYGTAGLGSRPLTIRYGFDAAEHLVRLEDDAGHVTHNTYDYRGHKTRMEDPNKGTWSYRYNAFGELKSQTDARQLVTRFDHDALGRSVRRVENATGVAGVPVRTTCSQYDRAAHGIGKLAVSALYEGTVACGQNAVASTGAVALERVAHRYDQFGRSDEVSTQLRDESGAGSQRFTTFTDYEADTGRISQQGYPEGFTVAHRYRADTGFLEAVYNANTDRIYRTITAMDAFGNVTGQKLGNGVTESRVHDPLSGYLTDITASGTRLLMDWRTRYDAAGNVIERRDAVQGRTEAFQYDAYYRLTAQQVDGQVARTYRYDRLGNILSKTGAGDQYEYDASRPHAVARIRHRGALRHGLEYDANGNATVSVDHERGVTRRMDYSAFDKPISITQGDTRIRFRYGASRNRYRRIDGSVSNGETIEAETTYIGKLFEQIRHTGGDRDGDTEYKFYVGNAVITETDYGSGQTDSKTHYLLGDHLGSVTTLLDESGEVFKRYRYDPFGEQYDMTGVGFFDKKPVLLAQAINRGFTGHEMLSAVGLIHMNGRIYDPRIGRFLQADPHVQDPKLSDNLNRYSYVLNNPLRYTDPSGYFFKTLKKHWRTIAAIAIAAAGGYYALEFVLTNPGLAYGIAAASGAVSGAISTGSLRGAAMGALTSVAFLGVGQAVRGAHWAAQVVGHAHMGGVLAGLQGGNYGHGFIRAGIAKGAQVAGFTSKEFFRGAFESAIVGGTASVLTGDKFANGAITAAFQSAMNNSITSALDRIGSQVAEVAESGADWLGEAVERGADLLGKYGSRALSTVGGAVQVATGTGFCTTGFGCVVGAPLVAHGVNNMYEGISGEDGLLRTGYQMAGEYLTGDAAYGDIAYGAVDIGTSFYSAAKMTLKPSAWKLYRYIPSDYTRAFNVTAPPVLTLNSFVDVNTVYDTVNRVNK